MGITKIEYEKLKMERLGETNVNNKGYPMKIIEYNNVNNIIVEFLDKYKAKVHTSYQCFLSGGIKNPYAPSVCGVGMIGNKYPARIKYKNTKEYKVWHNMLRRCFNKKEKERRPTYQNVSVCKEWLLFENFYEWLHSQENFEKWYSGFRWSIDKDILVKGNKIYSPETCCLVPNEINTLFERKENQRGKYPIGVSKTKNGYSATCSNPYGNTARWLGTYYTVEEAFQVYKKYKENLIKQIAEIEHNNGNITKKCYDAMLRYEVEITD